MNRNTRQSLLYIFADWLCSILICIVFAKMGRLIQDKTIAINQWFVIGASFIGLYWVLMYAFAGLYAKPLRRSRLQEFFQVIKFTFLGILILFFVIFLDDPVVQYGKYRITFTTYLALQGGGVSFLRFIITTRTNYRIRRRLMGFNTLLIGCGKEALDIYHLLEKSRKSLGYRFQGFICMDPDEQPTLPSQIKRLGTLADIDRLVKELTVEDIIVAIEPGQFHRLGEVIEVCDRVPVNIKIVPNSYDYVVGSVKISHILGAPLIEVFPEIMRPWEWVIKRMIDLSVGIAALILFLPLGLIIALLIVIESPGPVFYLQERVGKGGKPFQIYKFRSMVKDAEKAGPSLSQDDDPRITRIGKFLRKARLDEMPQFWNVLRGDMSIVGPRPERAFYIEQIIARAPQYRHLHKVRPGITSWGQVKYGYASTVEEMVERLKFDIIYIEQMSLALDIKIILYTIIVMIEGRGK